jgi:glycolate oxidase FAD binding subunit
VGLASVSAANLEAQLAALAENLGESGGRTDNGAGAVAMRSCSASELATLLAWGRQARAGQLAAVDGQVASDSPPPDPAAWLLRLGVSPNRGADLLSHPLLADRPVNLTAGSGLALAWADAGLPPEQVQELRLHCRALGGHLTVLRRPASSDPAADAALPAWEDAPSRPMIEAIKAQFDPKHQLAPGRLPGVARPTVPALKA